MTIIRKEKRVALIKVGNVTEEYKWKWGP